MSDVILVIGDVPEALRELALNYLREKALQAKSCIALM